MNRSAQQAQHPTCLLVALSSSGGELSKQTLRGPVHCPVSRRIARSGSRVEGVQ